MEFLIILVLVLAAIWSIGSSIDRLTKSLERDSAKVQSLLAEIRDRLDK